VMRLHG